MCVWKLALVALSFLKLLAVMYFCSLAAQSTVLTEKPAAALSLHRGAV